MDVFSELAAIAHAQRVLASRVDRCDRRLEEIERLLALDDAMPKSDVQRRVTGSALLRFRDEVEKIINREENGHEHATHGK